MPSTSARPSAVPPMSPDMMASTARFIRDLWTMEAGSTRWLASLIAWLWILVCAIA